VTTARKQATITSDDKGPLNPDGIEHKKKSMYYQRGNPQGSGGRGEQTDCFRRATTEKIA
jgi:hypothetical protein